MKKNNPLSNKVVAIVYVFKNNDTFGYRHFYNWSGKDIAMWLNAIEFLDCIPYIIDTQSFINLAFNNKLPHIDYVLNLNNGNINLDAMSLVTSVCEYLGIPCIPSSSTATLVGENKNLSNCIANSIGLNVPNEAKNCKQSIFRPNNLGNSTGIVLGNVNNCHNGIKQEFIQGYDVTVPILYSPSNCNLIALPAILYMDLDNNINWFLNETAKVQRNCYKKISLKLSNHINDLLLQFAKNINVNCYCRFDGRVKFNEPVEAEYFENNVINNDDFYFIEINSLPTIKDNTAFLNSLIISNEISNDINIFKEIYGEYNDVAFVLYCSMCKHL